MVLQGNDYTDWVVEPLVKDKRDIDLIAEFVTHPKCDVEAVNRRAEAFGERGLIRGHITYFDVYGQPGCWQDAVELVGTERLILETYDDPELGPRADPHLAGSQEDVHPLAGRGALRPAGTGRRRGVFDRDLAQAVRPVRRAV